MKEDPSYLLCMIRGDLARGLHLVEAGNKHIAMQQYQAIRMITTFLGDGEEFKEIWDKWVGEDRHNCLIRFEQLMDENFSL